MMNLNRVVRREDLVATSLSELILFILFFFLLLVAFQSALREQDRRDFVTAVVTLRDSDDYRFQDGSARLSTRFEASLREKALPEILGILDGVEMASVVIDVIGHTDPRPVQNCRSEDGSVPNTDSTLQQYLLIDNRQRPPVCAADNAGLGLARAVAVATFLRDQPSVPSSVRILPLSGGHLIDIDGSTADLHERTLSSYELQLRRRIEIRIRGRSYQRSQ